MAKASNAATAALPATIPVVTKDAPVLIELLAAASSNKSVADALVVDSPEMFEIATETLRGIRDAEKRCEEEKDKIAKPQYAAWKATNALFNPIAAALEAAKKTLGRKMIAFEDVERAKAKAAEMTAEAQRAKDIAEADAKLEAATEALASGDMSPEEYEAVATEALVAQVAHPISAVADPVDRGGHSRRERWVAEITDLPLFLEWLAKRLRLEDPLFDNTVEIKFGQLNAFGSSTQGTGKVPGVTFNNDSIIAARS